MAGLLTGAAGLGVAIASIGVAESVLVGGETREWCEGKQGYDSNHGPIERCVRERANHNLIASDEHDIELYRKETGQQVEVEFGDDSVTVSDGHGISATYPNSVFDDVR